jgi:hypothetical protein
LLLASNGTKVMRYSGRELEVIVPRKAAMFRKSCFEACA